MQLELTAMDSCIFHDILQLHCHLGLAGICRVASLFLINLVPNSNVQIRNYASACSTEYSTVNTDPERQGSRF